MKKVILLIALGCLIILSAKAEETPQFVTLEDNPWYVDLIRLAIYVCVISLALRILHAILTIRRKSSQEFILASVTISFIAGSLIWWWQS